MKLRERLGARADEENSGGMNMKRKNAAIALLLALTLLLSILPAQAADGNTMAFDKTVNRVFEGEELQLVLNRSGEPAQEEVSFTSSNVKRAIVDKNGVVTGLSKGNVTITATVKTAKKTYRAQLEVTVARKAESVTVKTGKIPVYKADDPLLDGLLFADVEEDVAALPVLLILLGASHTIEASCLPNDASNRRCVMTSSDEAVLTVKKNAIKGVEPGEAILTIANEWDSGVFAQYRVLVVQPVSKLQLTASAPSVAVGEQITITPQVLPQNASIPQVTWSSDNEKIALVDGNGVVTGIKRGDARITAKSTDGSNVRASISVKVTQSAEQITLNKTEFTLNVGKSRDLTATVLPSNANNKKVVWYSTDDQVATVNKEGRVRAVNVGVCQIVCASAENEAVCAAATVTVQQPVTKISFTQKEMEVYVGEVGYVQCIVEPANATNPTVKYTSSNSKIATVDEYGMVTPVKAGETYVNAISTDGSEIKGRIKVKVLQHVEGVHMRVDTAYIDPGEKTYATAVLEPKDASDNRMSWYSDNENVVTVSGSKNRVNLNGIRWGEATVIGVTEDGGYMTSLLVRVADWDHALKLKSFEISGKGMPLITVKNVSDLTITQVTAKVYYYTGEDGWTPAPVNTKDGSNVVDAVYRRTLYPGSTTRDDHWQLENYQEPEFDGCIHIVVKLYSYTVENGWVKTIQEHHRPSLEWAIY